MLEQELKDIWKNSSQTEKIKFETSRLLIDLDGKMNGIQKGIRRRDFSEIAASVFGIFLFGYFLYEIPFPLTKIGCALSILWFVYLIFKLKNNKNQKYPDNLTLPLGEQLANQKKNMLREAKLLDTVLYWYVLPPLFSNLLFIYGFGDPITYDWSPLLIEKLTNENLLYFLPISTKMKIIYLSSTILLNVFVIWINKRVATKTYKPIIEDIEKLQKQLNSENGVEN